MDIIDIPQQIRTSLKYSLRSRSSFLFSLLGAMLVCGVAFNVIYDFLFSHIYNKKESHYGPIFWVGLLTACIGLPAVYAILSIIKARRQERPFHPIGTESPSRPSTSSRSTPTPSAPRASCAPSTRL